MKTRKLNTLLQVLSKENWGGYQSSRKEKFSAWSFCHFKCTTSWEGQTVVLASWQKIWRRWSYYTVWEIEHLLYSPCDERSYLLIWRIFLFHFSKIKFIKMYLRGKKSLTQNVGAVSKVVKTCTENGFILLPCWCLFKCLQKCWATLYYDRTDGLIPF